MIDERDCHMRVSLLIRLREQITALHPIARHRVRHAVLHLSPRFTNQVLIPAAHVRDIGLTHRHLSLGCPSSVEVMGNGPAAGVGQERFQFYDFLAHPIGLGVASEWLAPC
jgi:hypothetical protein